MLAVQKYLRKKGLSSLQNELAIRVNRHSKYHNLVCLKYHQLDSPKTNPIVKECRGIILDERDDWRVVCWSYERFFNYGEDCAAEIDWATAKVYDKVDGSLMQLFYYNDEWIVASSGTADAFGMIELCNITLSELFWRTWNKLEYSLPIDSSKCYAFELCSAFNPIVVHYSLERIVLHGARNIGTLEQLDPRPIAENNGWECVKTYTLNSWSDIVKATKLLNPIEREGFVVCDAEFNRVKVKSPKYVALAHMKDGFSKRRMLEMIRTGEESDEFLSYFPQYTNLYKKTINKYNKLIDEIESAWELHRNIKDRKEFALQVKKYRFSFALFKLFVGANLREELGRIPIKQLEKIMEGVK